MGIVRLSKSGAQVQFIADDGTVYVTSTNYLMGLMQGTMAKNMVLLSKLPIPMSKDRFPESVLWDPNGLATKHNQYKATTTANDGSSKAFKKELHQEKRKEDILPW